MFLNKPGATGTIDPDDPLLSHARQIYIREFCARYTFAAIADHVFQELDVDRGGRFGCSLLAAELGEGEV